MKERHPVFRTLMLAACTDRLVQRIIGARDPEFDPVILAKTGDRAFVQNNLADGGQFDQFQLFGGALRGRIKAPRAVQRVAKQIKPHGAKVTGWENVDDATADRVIPRFGHRRALHKPHAYQKPPQCGFVDTVTHTGGKRGSSQHIACRHPLRCGVQRGEQNELVRHPMHQPCQRRHALRRNIGIGRHTIIGQTIPARKHNYRHIRREKAQRGLHRCHTLVIACNMQHRRATFAQFVQHCLRIKAFGDAGKRDLGFL